MNLNLEGKNALVCGSSKGIGKAAAIEIALLGANVTLVSRSEEKMATIIKELDRTKGQGHDFLIADFADSEDLSRKVKDLVSLKPIHILVNNTGGPRSGPILNATLNEFEQAFHNHLICSHILTSLVVPGMKNAGFGRIVNIISTSVKAPLDNLGVSNTIRAAVANWAKTMSNELGASGITVNNVLPGFTKTERLTEIIEVNASRKQVKEDVLIKQMQASVPLKRFGDPSEVGAAVAFLVSPAAGYITGTNLTVDGGRTKSL